MANSTALLDRHLFGPGPSNPYPEATQGLVQPLLGHLDPEFLAVVDDTCAMLRTVWGTDNARTLPLSTTGTGGMEAAFVNTVGPGDVAVIAVNGMFGERMCDLASRTGAEVVRVDHDWGQPIDPQRVAAAHPSPKVIAAVHAETTTGVVSDIGALGRLKGDALLITDAVTSIGGIELRVDDWGVDVGYAGSQKCLGVAPGLAPFTMNERAFARRIEHPTSFYLDIGLLSSYAGEVSANGGPRGYHHTASSAMFTSLHATLRRTLDEGLPQVWARHAEAGQILQDGLQKMGLNLFAAEGHRLPELTTVWVPDGVDAGEVRKTLLNRYNIEIGAGTGPYANSIWRIGLMGHNARPERANMVLSALSDVLGR